jgi:hypothetical protein
MATPTNILCYSLILSHSASSSSQIKTSHSHMFLLYKLLYMQLWCICDCSNICDCCKTFHTHMMSFHVKISPLSQSVNEDEEAEQSADLVYGLGSKKGISLDGIAINIFKRPKH